ncbi:MULTISPECIES: hypothetical protein [unclassified Aureispira]|uniref:hypothetical protein n=1 Tax=unclassified Aureispira TaxID=2649989 RepID=UPI0006977030|nr:MULTISPECIES: hypothetical protein [unclassified Aureispira]WMX14078.1 hypothetical protein QP953_24805 [Aureispira sp. CCB-E]
MKNLILLLSLVCGLATTMNAQVEKTLVKSVALATSTSAIVNLPGEVSLQEWDKDFIRVTTHLKVDNMSENIVKQLVVVGRYTLATDVDPSNGTLIITMPKVANQVTVKGVLLAEYLSFEINAPEGYQVIIESEENLDKASENGAVGQAM